MICSTTLKLTTATRFPMSTGKAIVPLLWTLWLFASRTLSPFESLILFHTYCGITSFRVDIDAGLVSNTIAWSCVSRRVIPVLEYAFVIPANYYEDCFRVALRRKSRHGGHKSQSCWSAAVTADEVAY